MTTEVIKKKKKNVARNRKLYWRKHTDVKDIEDFLEEKRVEERIGGPFKDKKDEELFRIDCDTNEEALKIEKSKLTKKQKALLPPRCYEIFNSLTAVPDPIVKRNRVRTPEERKGALRKAFEERKRLNGIIPHKIITARKSRAITIRRKQKIPKEQQFKKDLWDCTDNTGGENLSEWLGDDTKRHYRTNTGSFNVAIPAGVTKKKSVLPSIELPHPGTSYNPSLKDHQALLKIVVDKELEKQKEEAHIKRVTTDAFIKVTPSEKTNQWVEEMSQGLPNSGDVKTEVDVMEEGGDYKAINPPTNFLKKKTRQQRRKQKLEREAALKRKEAKVEKKKVADMYKLKFISNEIKDTESNQLNNLMNRQKLKELNVGRTKRLGGKQYEEQDAVFSRSCELRGNLRSINRQGNILAERFYSMQKRNLLVPSVKRIGLKKAKVKVFTKASHKIENLENTK